MGAYFLSRTKWGFFRGGLFPRPNLCKAIAKILFVLHSTYTWETLYRDWFDLDNSIK